MFERIVEFFRFDYMEIGWDKDKGKKVPFVNLWWDEPDRKYMNLFVWKFYCYMMWR